MKIQSLPVGEAFMSLSLAPHDVAVRAQADRRSGLADVFVKTGDHESFLQNFSDACALNLGPGRPSSLGADFRFACVGEGTVLLLGVRKVVALDRRTGQIRDVLVRFRQDADDHGFYHEDLFGVSDGIVLVYEGGAALISTNGEARWHAPLTWNDVLVRLEGNALRFAREEQDHSLREWTIDLCDGRSNDTGTT